MMNRQLGIEDLQGFIRDQSIVAAILPMDRKTSTVGDAAEALGVEPDRIIKTLVFRTPEGPLLVITNGLARVDRRKVSSTLGVGRNRVKFADAEQALAITGYVVGSMPPFGHREKLRTFVSPTVAELGVVYGGGGDVHAMMRVTAEELLRVTDGELVDVSE